MRVCTGGTFDILHAGHEALLAKAFELGDEEVLIGITSDRMARKTRKRANPLAVRRRNLRALLRRRRWRRARLSVLEDVAGPAAYEEDLDAIVVSADRSTNPVKVAATKTAFRRVFRIVNVKAVEVPRHVRPQPFEHETAAGAIARARAAIGNGDYGVGIEAGLFWDEAAKDYLDVQYCAIVDKRDLLSIGHGPGFRYPPTVLAAVRAGKTVGEAMAAVAGTKDIGRAEGAVGWLSRGAMDRTRLTEAAVLMALIPRIRRELYFA